MTDEAQSTKPREIGTKRLKRNFSDRRSYPSALLLRNLVRSAQECGITVGGIEVTPDGVLRIYDTSFDARAKVQNDFDRLEALL